MSYKKNPKNPDDYLDNLFMSVTDIFWSMVIDSDISEKEARKLIIRDVNMILDESLRQVEEDDVQ